MLRLVTLRSLIPAPGQRGAADRRLPLQRQETPWEESDGRHIQLLPPRPQLQGAGLLSHRHDTYILRLATLTLTIFFALPTAGWAQADYQEPMPADVQRERERANQALQEAQKLLRDPGFRDILNRDHETLNKPTHKRQAPSFSLPHRLPENIPLADRALKAAEAIRRDADPHFLDERIRPLVMISFGLPDHQLRALLAEAKRLDAAVYVRGLINDEWKDTIIALHRLAQDGLGSVSIDPTVFQRFGVTRVPTFVLPLERIEPCTNDGCAPVNHVRATGSTSLSYFLDYVGRTAHTKARHKARNWLAAHKENKP